MKAHGVPALIRHLAGEITLEEAATIGRADTRHYAKRQFTWFRHQLPEFEWVIRQCRRGDGWTRTAAVRTGPNASPESRSSSLRSRSAHTLESRMPDSNFHSPNARNPAKLAKSR